MGSPWIPSNGGLICEHCLLVRPSSISLNPPLEIIKLPTTLVLAVIQQDCKTTSFVVKVNKL